MKINLKFITILIMSCFYMNVGVKHFIEPEWFFSDNASNISPSLLSGLY